DERSHICGRALPSNTHHCHSRPEIGTVVPPHRSHSKACLFPTRLRCSARDLMCQLCPRFKLSTMCPVCTPSRHSRGRLCYGKEVDPVCSFNEAMISTRVS